MRKEFGITIALMMVLGSATSSFAQETAKVNAQKVGTPPSYFTGASVIDSNLGRTTRPKPGGPGGSEALHLQQGVNINLNIDSRIRPKPRGPGGHEALPQINSINQVQH